MMKNIVIGLCFCLLVLQAKAQFGFNGVVAHRGGVYPDRNIPENSLAAMAETARLGCYAVEIDVHLTKDLIPVVNHDHDFQGMDIATHNFSALQLKGKLSNGESLSTLDTYIKEARKYPALKVWVDIKKSNVDDARDVLTAQYVAEVIINNHASRDVAIIAPMFNAMVKIRMMDSLIKLYYIGVDKSASSLKLLGFDGVNLHWTRYDSEYDMEQLKQQGMMIGAYVVDDPIEMRRLLQKKVQFITTNNPQLLWDVVRDTP